MDFIKKLIATALAFAMAISFSGCVADPEYGKGIIITDDTRPSAEIGERAEGVFFDLLLHYYNGVSVSDLPDSTLEVFSAMAADIRDIVDSNPPAEMAYSLMLDILEERGEAVVDEIVSAKKWGGDYPLLSAFYSDMCALLGSDYLGGLIFELLVYYYDMSYDKNMSNYEKYGYTYMLQDAQKMKERSRVMQAEIGAEDFTTFLSSSLCLTNIFSGEIEGLDAFSDEEMLLFLTNLDLSLSISEEGWAILIADFSPYITSGIWSAYVKAMKRNGDASVVASYMEDILLLLRSVQSGLGTEDMALIREGDGKVLLASAFARFGDAEWQALYRISKMQLNNEEYENICKNKYGADYERYVAGLSVITADQLRGMVDSEKFYEGLEGFVGSISPAFSYGMRND